MFEKCKGDEWRRRLCKSQKVGSVFGYHADCMEYKVEGFTPHDLILANPLLVVLI